MRSIDHTRPSAPGRVFRRVAASIMPPAVAAAGIAVAAALSAAASAAATPCPAAAHGAAVADGPGAGGDEGTDAARRSLREAREEDLDALLERLPERHPNVFAVRSREAFLADAEALRARLDELDDVQFMIELSRLVASLGDAHTTLGKVIGQYPLQLAFFDDGPRALVLPKAHEELLGWKLVAVGETPMDEVMRRIATVDACETETSHLALARRMATVPEVLYGLGVAEPRRALFVFESDDGTRRGLRLEALDPGDEIEWAVRPPGADMVRMREPRRGALLVSIDDGRSLYLAYRRCAVDPRAPIGEAMKTLLERIDRESPRRVVIDLRSNGGGDSRLLSEWLPELAKRAKAHPPGWLAVLIDRHTFSSAMMNAWQLRRECGAVLYGEPTGGAKNHFGEVRSFTLPRSGWTVHHSTKYFRLDDDPTGPVAPDVRTRELWENYAAGRDVTLEAALAAAPSDGAADESGGPGGSSGSRGSSGGSGSDDSGSPAAPGGE